MGKGEKAMSPSSLGRLPEDLGGVGAGSPQLGHPLPALRHEVQHVQHEVIAGGALAPPPPDLLQEVHAVLVRPLALLQLPHRAWAGRTEGR